MTPTFKNRDMIYNAVLILIILFLRSDVLSKRNDTIRSNVENRNSNLAWLLIVIMAALRKPIDGTDVWGYMLQYNDMFNTSILDALNNERTNDYIGYFFTSKLFSLTGLSYHWWFGFIEALYVLALKSFVDKFSKDKLFSILVFVTCGLFSFSLAGLKQAMSMALMLFSFVRFIDKKYINSVLFFIYAYLCHPVSIVFLVAFPLYYLRNNTRFVFYIASGTILLYVFGLTIMKNLVSLMEMEHFEMYLSEDRSYSYVTFIFYIVIVALSCLKYGKYKAFDSNEARMVLGFSLLTCGLQLLAGFSPTMFRLAYFYSPFLMILLPNATNYAQKEEKTLVRTALIISIVFFYLYTMRNTSYPYSFFWQ